MSKSSEEGVVDNSAPQDGSGEAGAQKDANASIYEDRAGTKKIVRVVTVMAYVFSVSFTAILLSAYYVFIWEPPNPRLIQRSHLTSDPQAQYLAAYSPSSIGNISEKLSMIPDIQNLEKHFNNLDTIIARGDFETQTDSPQKLMASTTSFFKLHESAPSSAPLDDTHSPTGSPSTGLPFFHLAETKSRTTENVSNAEGDMSGDTTSGFMNPKIFFYATSRVTEVIENAATTEKVRETPVTMLANIAEIVENDVDHGTDLYSPDDNLFTNEMGKLEEFSGSFKTSVKRNESKDKAAYFQGRTSETTDSGLKEYTQDSKPLPAILTSGKAASTTPADMGAIIYRRLRLKFGDTTSPEPINGNVNDKDPETRVMQLPRKMSAQNMMASISRTLRTRSDSKSAAANEVKLAGEESKDKLYEPKHKQKVVRVLTVVAYVISVSLAAIILSLYYMYLWDPRDHLSKTYKAIGGNVTIKSKPGCGNSTDSPSGNVPSVTKHPAPIANDTTGSPEITTEESTPTVWVTQELRKQDETETTERNPEELVSGAKNAREITKKQK